jgi:hypothetical protein
MPPETVRDFLIRLSLGKVRSVHRDYWPLLQAMRERLVTVSKDGYFFFTNIKLTEQGQAAIA